MRFQDLLGMFLLAAVPAGVVMEPFLLPRPPIGDFDWRFLAFIFGMAWCFGVAFAAGRISTRRRKYSERDV